MQTRYSVIFSMFANIDLFVKAYPVFVLNHCAEARKRIIEQKSHSPYMIEALAPLFMP